MKFSLCKLERDTEGGIIAGKEIEVYEDKVMLAPGKEIKGKNGKKYRIRCVDSYPDGTKKAIVE